MNQILLIDDDPEIVKLNRKYLESRGHSIRAAGCGSEATAHIAEAVPDNRTIIYRSGSVLLSQAEFDLFLLLYKNKNRPISSEELYASLKDGQKDESNAIAVYIRRLRKKFEDFDESFGMIETLRNEGYRWIGG